MSVFGDDEEFAIVRLAVKVAAVEAPIKNCITSMTAMCFYLEIHAGVIRNVDPRFIKDKKKPSNGGDSQREPPMPTRTRPTPAQ